MAYDAKKKTPLTLVAHTRNMTGEEIKFTMHKLGEDSSLEDFSAAKVNQDGIAKLGFTMKDVNQLKKGEAETYFAGIEGFSAKHIKNRTLVLQVGAKWDSNTIQHSLTWGNKVSKEFRKKVVEICMDLWGDQDNMPQMANGLMAVMYRETGKTFAPHRIEGKELKQVSKLTRNDFARFNEKGEVNGSRAVGLIQFTQVALVALGDFVSGTGYDKLHTVKLRYARMSQLEQLEKVRDYFKKLSKLPKTPEDIYSAVFAPDAVEKKNSDTIYQLGTDGYKRNKSLDENNNGIQKIELINKFYESLAEGNKRGNIAPVMIEKSEDCKWKNPLDNPQITIYTSGGLKRPWRSAFGYVRTDNQRQHHGLDLFAEIGTSVYSCLPGKVVFTGTQTGYGKCIIIEVDKTYVNTFKKQRRSYSLYYIKTKRTYSNKEYDIDGYGDFNEYEGINSSENVYLFYAHLSNVHVKKDDIITNLNYKSKVIGNTGDTGATGTKGPHLHFEIRSEQNAKGYETRYNPAYYIQYKNEIELSDAEKATQKKVAGK